MPVRGVGYKLAISKWQFQKRKIGWCLVGDKLTISKRQVQKKKIGWCLVDDKLRKQTAVEKIPHLLRALIKKLKKKFLLQKRQI